jgi:hypothetical protein
MMPSSWHPQPWLKYNFYPEETFLFVSTLLLIFAAIETKGKPSFPSQRLRRLHPAQPPGRVDGGQQGGADSQ